MGANAQTAVPVFTAGQVLTAQQQTEINTGIPVFATTVTRDAAFGGASEKTLAEGQFAYIEATNTTQYYDGAAWQSVGTTPGLVCVKAETAFSAATSVTADNVFTSSYTTYQIRLRFLTSTSNAVLMKFRIGGVSTSTNYNFQDFYASNTTLSTSRSTAQTSGKIGTDSQGIIGQAVIDIFGPQLAAETSYTSIISVGQGAYTSTTGQQFFGNQSASTQFDGIEILVATGTMTGSYTIYGYSKTV